MRTQFDAPWGKLLWFFSAITVAVIVALVSACVAMLRAGEMAGFWIAVLGVFVLVGMIPFSCRGYRLEGDCLVIERLGWEKRVSLAELTTVHHEKNLLWPSLRVGNGGAFVFAGNFYSKKHGKMHVVGNDILGRPVLLETKTDKWVITPDDPAAFMEAVTPLVED